MKNKKLIIVGTSAFAEVAYEYFQNDSSYEVVAFSVEKEYIKEDKKFGLPVIALEEIEQFFPSNQYYFFTALVYKQMNRLRTRLYQVMKSRGYQPASYISSKCFIWKNVKIGEHCFIFEDNTLQPFVEIGNNVILWSGNHIGHHSKIDDNCFISSHVVISGFCHIKENCFFGVNSTIADQVVIEEDCFLGSGAIVTKNTEKAQVFNPPQTEVSKVSSLRLFKVRQ
ncbi:MAG: acetyltransferase [Aliarcobacter sp.]|nr:acetyltransferase [Aliarcobacter sp.]